MLDPIFLLPVALLTGGVAIGHLVFLRCCIGEYEGERRLLKEFECRVTAKVFGTISVIAFILLFIGQFR